MLLPEKIYQLGRRDAPDPKPRPFARRIATNQAAADVEAVLSLDFEADRIYLLYAVSLEIDGGGAQVPSSALLSIRPPTGTDDFPLKVSTPNPALGAGSSWPLDWTGFLPVYTGWRVRGRGIFSAGAVANDVVLNVHGCTIPPGTFR